MRDLPHLKYYRYKDSGQFEADVAYVAGRFRSVSYDEVVASRLRGSRALPSRSFSPSTTVSPNVMT